MCTDGAPVNAPTELGEHYLLTLCPTDKIELAIKNPFEQSHFNINCNKDYGNVYYLFKKVNLRLRLSIFRVLNIKIKEAWWSSVGRTPGISTDIPYS